jgi:hypothetical protein
MNPKTLVRFQKVAVVNMADAISASHGASKNDPHVVHHLNKAKAIITAMIQHAEGASQ